MTLKFNEISAYQRRKVLKRLITLKGKLEDIESKDVTIHVGAEIVNAYESIQKAIHLIERELKK
jgi:hypothetical protein